jgi:hypothetical protein
LPLFQKYTIHTFVLKAVSEVGRDLYGGHGVVQGTGRASLGKVLIVHGRQAIVADSGSSLDIRRVRGRSRSFRALSFHIHNWVEAQALVEKGRDLEEEQV